MLSSSLALPPTETDAVNKAGRTALHEACSVGKEAVVDLLLRYTAQKTGHKSISILYGVHLIIFLARVTNATVSRESASSAMNVPYISSVINRVEQDVATHLKKLDLCMCCRYGADTNKLTPAGENCLFLFLDHHSNLCHTSLLGRLLSLTSPLTISNGAGLLPRTLLLPQYSHQKEQLLALAHQPRSLMDICRIQLFQHYGVSRCQTLTQLLPERLHRYVLNYWESPCEINFVHQDGVKFNSWLESVADVEQVGINTPDILTPQRQGLSEH